MCLERIPVQGTFSFSICCIIIHWDAYLFFGTLNYSLRRLSILCDNMVQPSEVIAMSQVIEITLMGISLTLEGYVVICLD